MKQTLFFIFALSIYFSSYTAKGNSAAGGQLYYVWLRDSTYRFDFRYYNDCAGALPADTAQKLCFYNSCTDSSFSVTMPVYAWLDTVVNGGPPVPLIGCSGVKTKCDSPASLMSGHKAYVYSCTVTLPSRCSLWRFSVSVASLNSASNLNPIPNGGNLYLEATLNNLLFQGNWSPYFVVGPIKYVCANKNYSFNNGATDFNQDSLVTEIIEPLTRGSNCTDTIKKIAFANNMPLYSVPGNPFQTNNNLTLNANNGTINFTAVEPGIQTMAIRIKEYRNGILVGSIMRVFSFQVVTCVFDTPKITLDTTSIIGGYIASGKINGCVGEQLSFCWDVKAANSSTIFIASDNLHLISPNPITYTNQRRDLVRGCYSKLISINDTATKLLRLYISDETCNPPVEWFYYSQDFYLNVWAPTQIIKDTFICHGQSVKLYARNGANYTWSVISGSGASLSCNNCDSAIAQPTQATKYAVVSAASAFCNNNRDTVTVGVWPSIKSFVKIAVSDTVIDEGEPVIFLSKGVNCPSAVYQWQINGNNVPGADSSIFLYNGFKDLDTVTCTVLCNDTCATPPLAMSNAVVMHVTPALVSADNISSIRSFSIYPNPNSGHFILKGKLPASANIYIANVVGQMVYSGTLDGRSVQNEIVVNDIQSGIYILHVRTTNEGQSIRFNVTK